MGGGAEARGGAERGAGVGAGVGRRGQDEDWSSGCKLRCSSFSNAMTATTRDDVWDVINIASAGHAGWVKVDCESWGVMYEKVQVVLNMRNTI